MTIYQTRDAAQAHNTMGYHMLLKSLYEAAKAASMQVVVLTGRPEVESLLAGEWVAIPKANYDRLRESVSSLMPVVPTPSSTPDYREDS